MILDALLKVSAAQQVTADVASTNTIDLGNVTPKRKIGVGEPMAFIVCITAIGTNTGSTKLQAIYSANADLSSPTIIGEVDLATASLVAGHVTIIPIGQGGGAAARYLGMFHDITGTVDYTVDAYLVPQSMASIIAETYAKNYAV